MEARKKKRLRDLPLPSIYNGLDIKELDPRELHRSIESIPEFVRISLKGLTQIYSIDIGDFAHKDRRILVIDRDTIAALRSDIETYKYPEGGFLYCYSFEANIVAGHYSEPHEEGMLWWKRKWKSHHFLPELKIGSTKRNEFQDRVTEQVLVPSAKTGHSQRQIILFLIYSPNVCELENRVHKELKAEGHWLKQASFEDSSPGDEWFEVEASKAYKIATYHQKNIFSEYQKMEIEKIPQSFH
jgi:hypothetical protein